MISIATFLNPSGLTSSPNEEGIIRVYSHNSVLNSWHITEEFPFSLINSTSIFEFRSTILNMVKKLKDCRIFVAREVAGQLYSVLEANRFNIYEAAGEPEQFLDSILNLENEQKSIVQEISQNDTAYPQKTDNEGGYFLDLKAILNKDPNLTSKKVLLPFLSSKAFKTLEIICDHIPRWFNDEFDRQGLTSTVSKLSGNEYKVIISGQTIPSVQEAEKMRLSARNQFKGKVTEVKEGVVTAKVVVDIGGGKSITSTISLDAIKELDIKVGSEVTSIIKASSVMIAVD